MRYERVLLVNPLSHGEWRGIRPHIGQAYLAQTLLENGIEYDVMDMNLGYKYRHLQEKINDFNPDLIGMSLLSLEYKIFYDLLSRIKELNPKIKIVVGGPHLTIMKEQVLEDCSVIDYGVVREGEGTLVELCQGRIPEHEIKGLIFKERNGIAYSGDREFVENLDEIPWPRYEKFELNKYIREITIYSSRGCPHKCTFCPNRILSPKFRPRSAKNVVDEMEYWYSKGYRQFNFDDDNFNLIRERVFEICDEIERRKLKQLFLRCSNGIRADRADRDILARMKEIGFKYIAFGVDGGNNRILGIVKKGETIEQIEQAIKDSCDLGYDVKILFVVGTPGETTEDVEDKVRITKRYLIQEVHFYNIIPYPGTELYDWIKENNYFLKTPDDYLNDVSCLTNIPVFETPELQAKDRRKMFKYLNKVRSGVHGEAFLRMLGKSNLIARLASYILVNTFVEKLFYEKAFFRKIIDDFRYRSATRRACSESVTKMMEKS